MCEPIVPFVRATLMILYPLNAPNGGKFQRALLLGALLGSTGAWAAEPMPSRPAVVRQLAKLASHEYRVHPDTTLNKLSATHAREILVDFGSAHIDRVKAAFREEGLADAQVLPFAGVGPDLEALIARAEAFARREAGPRGPTHMGLAWQRGDEAWALVAVFSRRMVELAPLPRRLPARGLTIRGVSRATERLEGYLLGPCGRSCGPTRKLAVTHDKRRVEVAVPPTLGPGRYVFQLVRDGSRGPEVTAQWTFESGRAGARWPPPPPATADTADGARQLLAEARRRAELAPLQPQPSLDRAARAHAEAMCQSKVTAHQLPGGDTPAVRARSFGYAGVVDENVARAPSVAQAHQNLLLSPSHRLNLMNPAAHDVGVGVATAASEDGVAVSRCLVQLFGYQR